MPITEIHYWGSFARMSRIAGRDIREQWGALERFLRTCTDAPTAPPQASLRILVRAAYAEFLAKAVSKAQRLFGSPQMSAQCATPDAVQYWWELSADDFPPAIDFLLGGEPWYIDAVGLDFAHFFHWRDFFTGQVLPRQEWSATHGDPYVTHLYVFLGPQPRTYPHLRFPFPDVDASFLEFLTNLGSRVPFRMAPARFRFAQAPAEGTRFKYRRVPAHELSLIRRAKRARGLTSGR